MLDFWQQDMKIDRRHLSLLGSKVLAALVYNFFEVHVQSYMHPILKEEKNIPLLQEQVPLYVVEQEVINMWK